jgi:MinD-like ATPase involved in chromosome partitioning or flagellar assembly
MTNIAVVGDAHLADLLDLSGVNWTVSKADTGPALIEGLRNGTFANLSGVVLTDITGDSSTELMNVMGTLVLHRIHVVLVAFNPETLEFVQRVNEQFEANITSVFNTQLDARVARGESVPENERVNPIHSTFQAVVTPDAGAAGVICALAEFLNLPIPTLRPVLAQPLKNQGRFASLTTTSHNPVSRKGKVFAITSNKGGCGKTTVSLLLGAAIEYWSLMSGSPKTVAVIDLDSESQIRAQFPHVVKNVGRLRQNSTIEDVSAELHQVGEGAPNMYVLLGADNDGGQLSIRTPEFYEHVINKVAEIVDVVILDCSVRTYVDEVTIHAQQRADMTYYVIDQGVNSLELAKSTYRVVTIPLSEGGAVGLSPQQCRFVLSKMRIGLESADYFREHIRNIDGAIIEAEIPDSSPEVPEATDEGHLTDLVKTSPVLAPAFAAFALRALPGDLPPSIVEQAHRQTTPNAPQTDASTPLLTSKKRGWFNRG